MVFLPICIARAHIFSTSITTVLVHTRAVAITTKDALKNTVNYFIIRVYFPTLFPIKSKTS